jgi:hypothetical protein
MCDACEYVTTTSGVTVLVYWKMKERCLCIGHCDARLCLYGGRG